MSLYDLHANPESLYGYDRADKEVAALFWEKYRDKPAELKKREDAIARSPKHSAMYAMIVLKDRFLKGEPAIATVPQIAYRYAREVIGGRWPEGEKAIATSPGYSALYADLIRERFLAGEPVIAQSGSDAYFYATYIIQGRWPEGETAIATDPEYAIAYALKRRLYYDEENKRFVER